MAIAGTKPLSHVDVLLSDGTEIVFMAPPKIIAHDGTSHRLSLEQIASYETRLTSLESASSSSEDGIFNAYIQFKKDLESSIPMLFSPVLSRSRHTNAYQKKAACSKGFSISFFKRK